MFTMEKLTMQIKAHDCGKNKTKNLFEVKAEEIVMLGDEIRKSADCYWDRRTADTDEWRATAQEEFGLLVKYNSDACDNVFLYLSLIHPWVPFFFVHVTATTTVTMTTTIITTITTTTTPTSPTT